MHALLKSTALAALLTLGSLAPSDARSAFEPVPAVFVVIENGGVVQDTEFTALVVTRTLGELVQLRRKKATRETQIHIVLSASPTEIAWSGTPDDLEEQGFAVLELATTFRPTCSDLTLAYEQVAMTRRVTRPSSMRIVAIGPVINAPYPCDEGDGVITLPQALSSDVLLGQLALEADQLRLVGVHADQDEAVLDHLEAAGVMDRANDGHLDFDLMGPARTKAALGHIMGRN
jgi:hypothetical protein